MKKALIAIVALLAAGAAIAQMTPQHAPRPEAALAAYLQLTPDQIATWQQIAKDTAAAVKPLADNEQQLRKQVQTALQASSPDPAAVGKLVVAAGAVRDQIRTLRDAAKAKRLAVLTPDQKVKHDAFEAALIFLRQHRARPNA
jgi:Spy/CpxP family protein refolding chaperone